MSSSEQDARQVNDQASSSVAVAPRKPKEAPKDETPEERESRLGREWLEQRQRHG